MISILIPVYNHPVQKLVSELLDQLELADRPFEIILVDDASTIENHAELSELSSKDNIQVHFNNHNVGRVATRNRLAFLAQYEYLLFIDCDAQIISKDYIQNYLNLLSQRKVLVGGHLYQPHAPQKELKLHWKYGTRIESKPASKRVMHPYRSFSSFNFCIPKRIFEDCFYKISIEGYGHEDTYLGYQLEREKAEIVHIENPLMHIGLKTTDAFVKDQIQAISNAQLLSEQFEELDIKVIRWSNILKSLSLNKLIAFLIKPFLNLILKQLSSGKPSLALLQVFKLYHTLK